MLFEDHPVLSSIWHSEGFMSGKETSPGGGTPVFRAKDPGLKIFWVWSRRRVDSYSFLQGAGRVNLMRVSNFSLG